MNRQPMTRAGRVNPKRATPRRRDAPQWDRDGWEAANWQLTSRANGCCEKCRTNLQGPLAPAAERHHRMRRRDGGDRLANLLLICQPCHQWITEHPTEAVEQGWIIPVTAADIEHVPVRLADGYLWYLRDDGTRVPVP